MAFFGLFSSKPRTFLNTDEQRKAFDLASKILKDNQGTPSVRAAIAQALSVLGLNKAGIDSPIERTMTLLVGQACHLSTNEPADVEFHCKTVSPDKLSLAFSQAANWS